jgi:hypothetical protein
MLQVENVKKMLRKCQENVPRRDKQILQDYIPTTFHNYSTSLQRDVRNERDVMGIAWYSETIVQNDQTSRLRLLLKSALN